MTLFVCDIPPDVALALAERLEAMADEMERKPLTGHQRSALDHLQSFGRSIEHYARTAKKEGTVRGPHLDKLKARIRLHLLEYQREQVEVKA